MNLKHTHHRINTLIIDLNRISVINNNRHTNFRQDKLRQFEKCYQSKHLLKEDLRYLLSLIYGTMKIQTLEITPASPYHRT